MTYAINFWGSHPDEDNDDCWIGSEYQDAATALEAFASDPMELAMSWCTVSATEGASTQRMAALASLAQSVRDSAYIELDGPNVHGVRKNPYFKRGRKDADDRAWRAERAMEAGMLHGCDAYNDVLDGD